MLLLFDVIPLNLLYKGITVLEEEGAAVRAGKAGDFPVEVGVKTFVIDDIKIHTFPWVVADAEVGTYLPNVAIILDESIG